MEKRSREMNDFKNKEQRERAFEQVAAICLEKDKEESINTPRSLTWSGEGNKTPFRP